MGDIGGARASKNGKRCEKWVENIFLKNNIFVGNYSDYKTKKSRDELGKKYGVFVLRQVPFYNPADKKYCKTEYVIYDYRNNTEERIEVKFQKNPGSAKSKVFQNWEHIIEGHYPENELTLILEGSELQNYLQYFKRKAEKYQGEKNVHVENIAEFELRFCRQYL